MKNELEEILIQKKKCKFLLHVLNKPKIVSKPKINVDQNSLPSSNSSPLPVNKSVEVKLPNLAESFGQKFYTLFFYCNLYLHFLRPCCENIFYIVVQFQRKIGNKSDSLTYFSSLQPVIIYNFSEFKVPFQCHFEITWPNVSSSVAQFPFV